MTQGAAGGGQSAPRGLGGQHEVWASPSVMWGPLGDIDWKRTGGIFCFKRIFLCALCKPDHFRGKAGGREASWEAAVAPRREVMVGLAGEVSRRWWIVVLFRTEVSQQD